MERNALCVHLPVIPRTLIRGVVIPLGITVLFALNIYEGSFTSVSSRVNSPSSLVSPLWPLVSVYNSHSLEDCPTSYFLCPHIYLLKLYCVNSHMLIFCLGPLSLRIVPRPSRVWLSPHVRQQCLTQLSFQRRAADPGRLLGVIRRPWVLAAASVMAKRKSA